MIEDLFVNVVDISVDLLHDSVDDDPRFEGSLYLNVVGDKIVNVKYIIGVTLLMENILVDEVVGKEGSVAVGVVVNGDVVVIVGDSVDVIVVDFVDGSVVIGSVVLVVVATVVFVVSLVVLMVVVGDLVDV